MASHLPRPDLAPTQRVLLATQGQLPSPARRPPALPGSTLPPSLHLGLGPRCRIPSPLLDYLLSERPQPHQSHGSAPLTRLPWPRASPWDVACVSPTRLKHMTRNRDVHTNKEPTAALASLAWLPSLPSAGGASPYFSCSPSPPPLECLPCRPVPFVLRGCSIVLGNERRESE